MNFNILLTTFEGSVTSPSYPLSFLQPLKLVPPRGLNHVNAQDGDDVWWLSPAANASAHLNGRVGTYAGCY